MLQILNTIAALASGGALSAEHFDWPSLRYQHTAALRSLLAERFSPATTNKALAALRGVLKEAWRLGYLSAEDYHSASDLQTVRGQRLPRGRMLSSGEVRALFRSCAEDGSMGAALDAAMLALLIGCGLRRSEAVRLRVDDYEPEAGELRVRRGKGNKERLVPLVNGQKDAVDAWLERRGHEGGALLCPVGRGGRIEVRSFTTQALYQRLLRRARAAEVRAFAPHDLRRTFISSLLDHGADISAVQRLAGHESVTTTTGYDRRDERATRKAAGLLHVPYVAF